MVGNVHSQTDINEQITAATSDEPSRSRWEQYRYLTDDEGRILASPQYVLLYMEGTDDNEKNVGCLDHCVVVV